jgi:predicted DNA-binding WGR domain protein
MTPVHLRRVDPTRNMRRFYRLDVLPDLSGGVLLVKEWGRTGAYGRTVAERYDDETLARAVVNRTRKRAAMWLPSLTRPFPALRHSGAFVKTLDESQNSRQAGAMRGPVSGEPVTECIQ